MNEYEIRDEEESEKIGKELEDYVNSTLSTKQKYLSDYIVNRMHRYLQGELFRLFLHIIRKWAETENYDARNEFAVKESRYIMKCLDESDPKDINSLPVYKSKWGF